MLKAIIFDFNGVILDDEHLHFRSMRDAVALAGLEITEEEYWSHYLPLDDVRCLNAIVQRHSASLTETQKHLVLKAKRDRYLELLENRYPLFPGADNLIRRASDVYPLAIASGARRDEIEQTLAAAKLRQCFRVIVGAEDFKQGKPHPASFLTALERLNERLNGEDPIQPRECLVVEDSIGGVEGSRAAGMRCLAVSNTYPPDRLNNADRVVSSLEKVDLEALQGLFVN